MLPAIVDAKLAALPTAPGVYVFRDRHGGVLYVGKARNLRSRVRSYFQPKTADTRFFVARLPQEIGDLETFVVANEKEAALLENALIKEHKPRYNVKLRDDKDFLSIRLDFREDWPRLQVVRRPRPDGAMYFGPYDSATAVRRTLRLVHRSFKLRTCKDTEFRNRVRPCLQYQIGRCSAPCVLPVDRTEYLEQARLVALFLEGRHDDLVRDLEERMKAAAALQEYERAAVYRDQLRAIERVREHQRIEVVADVDRDVIGLFVQGDRAEVALVLVRKGRTVHVRTFDLSSIGVPDDEIIASFVGHYYATVTAIPDEILLPVEIEAREGLAQVLSEKRGRKVRILVPRRGPRAALVRMANDNAAHAFKEKQRDKEDLEARLAEVQRVLRLPRPPRRIECLDISHLGGSDTVAAIAALTDGAPDRRRYKSFHVHTVAGGDDYGAMKEVLSRRLAHAGEVGWELPDLLVVDGGKGQLGVAMAVLRDLGISDVPVCALAKEKDIGGQSRRERIYLPGRKNPLVLADRSATRSMIGMVRDEAHRLSNDLRKKLGRRRRLRSDLEDVPGIGRRTRTKLLTALGSLEAVIAADEATLVAAGATARQARAIRAAFHSDEASGVSATRTDVDRTMALGPRELPGAESSSANEAEVDPATESKAAFSGTVAIAWGRESADESSAPSGAAETDADAEEIALSNAFESLEGPSRSPVTPWSAHSGSPVQRRAIDEA